MEKTMRETYQTILFDEKILRVGSNIDIMYNDKLRNCTIKVIYKTCILAVDHSNETIKEFRLCKTKSINVRIF